MVGTSKFEDLDSQTSFFVLQGVAQDDDVVGCEFLDAEPGDFAVFLGMLGGENSGNPYFFKGGDNPKKFLADDGLILESGEYGADGIHGQPFGPHLAYCMFYAGEQGAEIVVADDGHLLLGLGRGVDKGPFSPAFSISIDFQVVFTHMPGGANAF